MVEEHINVISTSESINGVLSWLHAAINNLKRKVWGIYNRIREKYLQNYLKEFTYTFNRICNGENCLID